MTIKYSIAEARNQFAALIREVGERHEAVQVTRHGAPVAVILSHDDYERLLAGRITQDFWQSYEAWRREWQVAEWEDEADPFEDVRDRSPGREVDLFQ